MIKSLEIEKHRCVFRENEFPVLNLVTYKVINSKW